MTPEQQVLYERLLAFEFDDGPVEQPFAQRLSEENNWSLDFAARVIDEYRRFIFLMVFADHPCTPSSTVDKAWHLHLTYTRSYWDRLCRQTIGRPLHHNPGGGSEAEATKFSEWHCRTLDSYRSFFAEKPPADIWPDPPRAKGRDGAGFLASCGGGCGASKPIDTGSGIADGGSSCGSGCGGGCGGA